jgi:NADH:ubiquinone oxidoreductase subunit 3 (subunit A)
MTFYFQEIQSICILFIFSTILAFIILFLSYRLSTSNPDSEKVSAYECGFEPFGDARDNFDIHFYVVALLFIIFDVEIIF